MKKLFTIDDFMVPFISSLGYGFGETISRLSGWSDIMCTVASFALGLFLEEVVSNIAFSRTVQSKPQNRALIYGAFFLIFLGAHYFSVRWMGVSMLDYLMEEIQFAVVLPLLGLGVNLLIRRYRVLKIRKLYGDGSKGFVFDVEKGELEDLNEENRPISGEYDSECAVKTRTGIYVGEKEGDVISYLGIPYAMPPVGQRRWKAPEPLPASEAVFEAKHFGASPIQVEHTGTLLKNHRQSEDCLSLNIYVGTEGEDSKKPVLMLFPHGDFSYGGSSNPLLSGENFVKNHPDVVFVSFNYRIGIFGFIDFSEVPGGGAYPDALNLGLLDQIQALQWVKENIAAFGGDPGRITAIGFGSGATSISLLAASGRAAGLFKNAFIFSGSPAIAYDNTDASRTLAKNLLNETGTQTMEGLIQFDTEALKNAAQKLWKDLCAPTWDGTLIPTDPYKAYQEAAAAGIDFIIGIPGNQRQVFRSAVGEQNYGDYVDMDLAWMQAYVDDAIWDAMRAYIEKEAKETSELEAKGRLVEQWTSLCIYRSAAKLKEGGNKVHLMYWDEKPLIENLGSGVVDAIAALFGNSDASQLYGSVVDKDLSEVLQTLLEKFINGNSLKLYPNEIQGVDAFDWKAFPKALIVSGGKCHCDTIEDKLSGVEGLLEFMVK